MAEFAGIREAKIEIKGDGSIEFTPPNSPSVRTFEDVAVALECSQALSEIKVIWEVHPDNVNFRLMLQWIKVASKLRALPSLKSIEVLAFWMYPIQGDAFLLKYPFMDMFFDSMPDKVAKLDTDDLRPATLLGKRKCPLECGIFADFCVRDEERAYFADVLRFNSKRIELTLTRAHQFYNWGPLGRNDFLQQLQIWDANVADSGIPRALHFLRSINDHFNLEWQHDSSCWLQEPADLEQMEDVKTEAMEIATAMGNAGFRTKDDILLISVGDCKGWQDVSRDQVIEHLGWDREGPTGNAMTSRAHKCSHVHNGACIVVNLM